MCAAMLVYTTCGNHQEATAVARAVVEAKLAACANIFPPHTAVYQWQGAVEEEPEVAMILKTSEDRVALLIEKIKSVHSYDCPAIVAWPIAAGNPAFIEWIHAETNTA